MAVVASDSILVWNTTYVDSVYTFATKTKLIKFDAQFLLLLKVRTGLKV
jgi:hypothetical protein